LGGFLNRWRRPRLGVVGRELTMGRWNQAHRAFGVISPTVRISVFFADVMEPGNLIF